MTASFHILSNSSFTYHPFIRRYIVLIAEKASLNKLENKIGPSESVSPHQHEQQQT
jgi:hypothetical protein